jgi:hypothetical protein
MPPRRIKSTDPFNRPMMRTLRERTTIGSPAARDRKGGFYRSTMWDGKNWYVHVLLAECFIDNPDGKPEVNHRDGCKSNNLILNLEWATRQENMRHAADTGLLKQPGGKT